MAEISPQIWGEIMETIREILGNTIFWLQMSQLFLLVAVFVQMRITREMRSEFRLKEHLTRQRIDELERRNNE